MTPVNAFCFGVLLGSALAAITAVLAVRMADRDLATQGEGFGPYYLPKGEVSMVPAMGIPEFQSLVITLGWFGLRVEASLANGMLRKGWSRDEERLWSTS